MSRNLTNEQSKKIVKDLLVKVRSRLKQEFLGDNEEFLDRVLRQFRARIARHIWKASQKWSKWEKEGPVLMPDNTRIYYRKGNTEVLLQEFQPQIRMMKFSKSLCLSSAEEAQANRPLAEIVSHYSLALPYVIFLFKFIGGAFVEVRCAFSDRPLKHLDEQPLRPYFSNIDSNLCVCLGRDFNRDFLIRGNIIQQTSLVLSHFWQAVSSDEWSAHFWANKAHFQQNQPKLATMEAWQEASFENPLFVIEGVQWLKHHETSFGDIICRLLEGDNENKLLQEELYDDLVKNFLEEIKKSLTETLDTLGDRVIEASAEQLGNELIQQFNS